MNELVTAQTFVLGSALIVAAFLTLEWVETRRTRVELAIPITEPTRKQVHDEGHADDRSGPHDRRAGRLCGIS